MRELTFSELKKDHLARSGKINLNGSTLQTPICWFGLSNRETSEFQQDAFYQAGIKCFMSNAFDLQYIDKKGTRRELIDVLKHRRLCQKVDSGGFQWMKMEMKNQGDKFPLTQERVYALQKEIDAQVGVQLDFPMNPALNRKQNKKRMDQTLSNLRTLIEIENGQFPVLPVIHGYDKEMFDYAINKIERILEGPIPQIGIGGLVPMLRDLQGSAKSGGKKTVVELLIKLRMRLPDTFIHVFGIGGNLAYLAAYCGADSIDSTGWILKTAYGTIQLPGISDRFLNKREHNRAYLSEARKYRKDLPPVNEIALFMDCNCPSCKPFRKEQWTQKNWLAKQAAFKEYSEESRKKRVIHNLWLFQTEMDRIQEAIQQQNLTVFIAQRLKYSKYIPLFQYACELINSNNS